MDAVEFIKLTHKEYCGEITDKTFEYRDFSNHSYLYYLLQFFNMNDSLLSKSFCVSHFNNFYLIPSIKTTKKCFMCQYEKKPECPAHYHYRIDPSFIQLCRQYFYDVSVFDTNIDFNYYLDYDNIVKGVRYIVNNYKYNQRLFDFMHFAIHKTLIQLDNIDSGEFKKNIKTTKKEIERKKESCARAVIDMIRIIDKYDRSFFVNIDKIFSMMQRYKYNDYELLVKYKILDCLIEIDVLKAYQCSMNKTYILTHLYLGDYYKSAQIADDIFVRFPFNQAVSILSKFYDTKYVDRILSNYARNTRRKIMLS